MKTLEEKILNAVGENTPQPEWQFVLKQVALYGALTLSILLGGSAIAHLLYGVFEVHIFEDSELMMMMLRHPIFLVWMFSLGLFIAIATLTAEHTSTGYRIRVRTWVAINLGITICASIGLLIIGLPRAMDQFFSTQIQPMSVASFRDHTWKNPQAGRLRGKVTVLTPEGFEIELPGEHMWSIRITPRTLPHRPPKPGDIARVMGKPIPGRQELEARRIIVE